MSKEDLKPVRTTEEARELGRSGGIASGEARRKKRAMKETLNILLDMATKDGELFDIEEAQNLMQLEGKPITVEQAILVAQIIKATKGDTRAAEYVRDTSGNKPVENIAVEQKSESVREMEEYLYGEDTPNAEE